MKNALKRSLSVLLALTFIFSSAIVGLSEVDFGGLFAIKAKAANSGSCGDNLTWKLDNNTLTISGAGEMSTYWSYSDVPWYSLRSNIKNAVISNGVTNIGGDAFYDCSNLTSVVISDSITSIGSFAFYNCTSLTSITIPDSVKKISERAFAECANLTTINIPDGVTSIGYETFRNCDSLTSITIPGSVTSIHDGAFPDCNKLVSLIVDFSNENFCSVDGVLFNKTKTKIIQYPAGKINAYYTIPHSVTSVGDETFESSHNLNFVTITDNVTNIGYNAFENCYSLTSIEIPNSVTSIGDGAFEGCTSLKSFKIPNSITSIGNHVFYECERLTSITIPDSVTSIGGYAFAYCTNLASITIPDSVTSISGSVFSQTAYYNNEYNWENGVLYIGNHLISGKKYDFDVEGNIAFEVEGEYAIRQGTKTIAYGAFRDCDKLTSVIIPDSIKKIAGTFGGCDGLTSVKIAGGVKEIGAFAFGGCDNLPSITIPDSVTSIGESAFSDCDSLASITIPDSVTEIEARAFDDCDKLITAIIGHGVTKIGYELFMSCDSLTSITIPDSVTSIGYFAFRYCDNLTRVLIPENVTYINDTAFYDSDNVTIYGVLGSYAQTFANKRGIPFSVESKFGDFYFQEEVTNDSYTINVRALDKNGGDIPAKYADVTVYSGADVVLSKKTNEAGQVTFTKEELFKNGVREDGGLLGCTVSAHLDAGEITLCSEEVLGNGVWAGASLSSCVELTCDEPRWYIDNVTVAYMYRSGYLSKLESRMEQFASEFAKTTNGHVIINGFSYIPCTSNSSVNNQKDADIRINDKGRFFSGFKTGAATRGMLERTDISSGIDFTLNNYIYGTGKYDPYITINWNAPNFVSTLCHEAGHYFLGFYDEYCYGLGYDYDVDRDGVIESKETGKNYGNWSTHEGKAQNGKVPRPENAPRNFGLMDVQWASATSKEISTSASYNYLDSLNLRSVDESQPEMYTRQYYVLGASCEEKLAYELNHLADIAGYSTSYDFAENGIQDARYDYVSVNHSYYSNDTTYTLTDKEKEMYLSAEGTLRNLDDIHFSYKDDLLTITKSSKDTYLFMENISDDSVIVCSFDENNQLSFDSSNLEGCVLSVIKEIDGTYYKNEYSISFISSNEYNDNIISFTTEEGAKTAIISYDIAIENGDYKTASSVYKIISDSKINVEGCISEYVGADAQLNLSTASWFVLQNTVWTVQDTNYNISEHGECLFTTNFSGTDITLALMAKQSAATIYEAPTNLIVSADNTIYDEQIKVCFEDGNNAEDIRSYIIYYSEKPFDVVSDKLNSMVILSGTNDCYISLDEIDKEYYFAVVAVGKDGARSPISEIVSYMPASKDTNDDGIPDSWMDIYYQLSDSDNIATTDTDCDGLTNLQEYENGTNPLSPDTDGDNVYDGIEVMNTLNPLEPKTDGVTDDYTIVYGTPDLKISDITFDDEYVYFNVNNETDGKAMRTFIEVMCGEESIVSWTANIYSKSSMNFSFEKNLITDWNGFEIRIDNCQITRDIDYTNNSFEYIPATNIALEDITLVKGSSYTLNINSQPADINELYKWSYTTTNNNIIIDTETGTVTTKGVGVANITIETLSGLFADCTITVIPFEGSYYTGFDCEVINEDSEVAITGYFGDDEVITIPESIGGYTVTQLNANCIDYGVTDVTIPSSVTSINKNAFQTASILEFIHVDENNSYYASVDGVLFNKEKTTLIRYPKGKTDNKYIIPDSVTSIGEASFADTGITELTLSENIASIAKLAFANCNNLYRINYNAVNCTLAISAIFGKNNHPFTNSKKITELIIGEKVSSIHSSMFKEMSSIESVFVTDLKHWCSIDFKGVNANPLSFAENFCINGELITELVIPDGVEAIKKYAFYKATCFDSVIIPDSVTSIGANAFAGCPTLAKIEIPESVESIDTTAFTDSINTAIFCQKDSNAHTFAIDNSMPFIANDDNTMVDLSKNVIQTNYLNAEIVDIMAMSRGLTYSINSDVSGTGTLVDVLKEGLLHSQFTLVVNGDTNGDSICDALDCFEVERAANGNTNLSGAYAMAADSNSDDVVDITDYQAIVNKALAS